MVINLANSLFGPSFWTLTSKKTYMFAWLLKRQVQAFLHQTNYLEAMQTAPYQPYINKINLDSHKNKPTKHELNLVWP